ncbi:MAG: hypothetical protein DRJ08_06610 [Acidobacteria bacterium]|nr:MAG: hypothetical protein DRJ14_02440 [Acidobacteriota bacterium]RLE20703.1 MAG: hypothetical protein DRJ08_06610 [Acidobacteriota bacterium]
MENNIQTKPMTVGDWFVTILILAIPLVNIVMYLVWAFSSTGNLNRKNFCIASLIWMLIGIAIAILVIGFVSLIGVAAMSH